MLRFWLERGVDGFRLDTVNYYFHDRQLRSNPPARRPKHLPYAVNPYDMQQHKYGKSQPENVAFLKRVRKLMDQFPGTTTVGEVGDSHIGLQLMGEYTSGGDKLHMAYTFDMLGNEFTAEDAGTATRWTSACGTVTSYYAGIEGRFSDDGQSISATEFWASRLASGGEIRWDFELKLAR